MPDVYCVGAERGHPDGALGMEEEQYSSDSVRQGFAGALLFAGVHRSADRFVRRCQGPDGFHVVPFGEVLDGFGDFGRYGRSLSSIQATKRFR